MPKTDRYEVQPNAPVRINTYHFFDHKRIWRHWHEYLEILYFVKGSVSLRVNGLTLQAQREDIVVFNEREVHESLDLSSSNEYYVFVIPPEFFQSPKTKNNQSFETVIREDEGCLRLVREAAKIVDAGDGGSEYLLNAKLFELLHHISLRHTRAVPAAQRLRETKALVEDLEHRIRYCYPESFNIGELAASFCVSESHLQHAFKEKTGMSIVSYINRTRVENAAQLLRGSESSIAEIAARVGFSDYNYFSRVFRKYRGLSPSAFRAQNG